MAKKPVKKNPVNTQPQLSRLHGLVQRIQKGDYPSAKILANEWEKSWSTIIRDLEFIRNDWHLPLAYDEKRYGFYFTEPIGKFPMVPISEQELVSVFVAQKALHQYRGTPFEEPLRSAFSKLVSSLEGELSVAWADLDAAISFRGIESDPNDMEVLQRLGEAIRQRRELQFVYYKLERDENPKSKIPKSKPPKAHADGGELRRVQPYHLACVGGQWYLFAYDLMRRDMRKFVPARMRNLQVKARRFHWPQDFDIDKLLKGSFGIFSGGELVPIRIWFGRGRAQVIRERKWHHSQKIKELAEGELELGLELSSFAEIVPWILSWGEHAKAIAPKELVDEVRETARRVVQAY